MKTIVEPPLPNLDEVFGRSWYVAQVAAHREQLVAELMRSRDHGAIVPVVQRFRHPNRFVKNKRKLSFPRLPCYVIVGFEGSAMQPWFDLFSITFVRGVVSDDAGPMPVDRAELLRFMRETGESTVSVPEWEAFMATGHEFGPGDEVRVMAGPFEDQRVKVETIQGASATILLRLFGRKTRRVLPLAQLQRVE